MSRPPRIQAPGALYHVTSRGIRRALIFVDEYDHQVWLGMLGETVARFQFVVYAYCQMPNHYHLVLETPLGNIAAGMHYLNGKYCQYFNRKHQLQGHVAQGRYYAEVIQREQHLLELARYVVLNPVRAGLVDDAAQWKWSNHQAFLNLVPAPFWLDVDGILGQFGNGGRGEHQCAYHAFVQQGRGMPHPLRHVRRQRLLSHLHPSDDPALALSLPEFCARFDDQEEAIFRAYLSSAYSIREIARYLNVSPRSVIRRLQRAGANHRPETMDFDPS